MAQEPIQTDGRSVTAAHPSGAVLHTASFYAVDDWRGLRYRVSRSHPRGRKAEWETLPFLYPPRELLAVYRAGALGFSAFSREYVAYLEERKRSSAEFQDWLQAAPSRGEFTLLCFERAGEHCHRLVLAEWLLKQAPGLARGSIR